ncbi:MAG TPA: L,D-transpeptidase family protein [Geobacteraceae bacterium]
METRNPLIFLLVLLFLSAASAVATDLVADRVLIEKRARRLTIYSCGQEIKTYKVALGRNPNGPRDREGDNKTPEGIYTINSRNNNSRYHLSLHISYPNSQDIQHAKSQGVSPGGNIMIHGIMNGLGWLGRFHRWVDWTKGCIAVTNPEIEEIAWLVPNGTRVEIRP